MMTGTIYIATSTPVETLENKILKPIHVGSSLHDFKTSMLADNTGDNISGKNEKYSEMTAIYWAWKNDIYSEYIGLMHYRRYLHVGEINSKTVHKKNGVKIDKIDKDTINMLGLSEEKISQLMDEYDLLVPKPYDTRNSKCANNFDLYIKSENHLQIHLDLMTNIIEENNPKFRPYWNNALASHNLYACNIFIMKRALFHEYCEFIFPMLEEIEKSINFTQLTQNEKRVIGFLAERIFTAFVFKIQHEKHHRILKTNRAIINHLNPLPDSNIFLINQNELCRVSIALCIDNNYLSHACTVISSIISNWDASKTYELFILSETENIDQLKNILAQFYSFKNLTIKIITTNDSFKDAPSRGHITTATYLRLKLPELLFFRSKILYLDADIIVTSDISKLYETDISQHYLAACQDLMMQHMINTGATSSKETGALTAKNYCAKYLNLNESINKYFQAGVLLLNLDKIRQDSKNKEWFDKLHTTKYWWFDQDILNTTLSSSIKYLDLSWNFSYLTDKQYSELGEQHRFIYAKASKNPKIIHFVGSNKPWNNWEHPYSALYWHYCRKSVLYETLILNNMHGLSFSSNIDYIHVANVVKKIHKQRKKSPIQKIKKRINKHLLAWSRMYK